MDTPSSSKSQSKISLPESPPPERKSGGIRRKKSKTSKKKKDKDGSSTSMFKSALGYFWGSPHKDEQESHPNISVTSDSVTNIASSVTSSEKSGTGSGSVSFSSSLRINPVEDSTISFEQIQLQKAINSDAPMTLSLPSSNTKQSFPIVHQRPSGVLPRQNSSGINAILEESLTLKNSTEGKVTTSNQNEKENTIHVRNAYEQPKIPKHSPLCLTNIFADRIKDDSNKGNPPRILNRAFFDSISQDVQKMKTSTSASVGPERYSSSEADHQLHHQPPTSNTNSRSLASSNHSLPRDADSNGNVNINLTLQVQQSSKDGKQTTSAEVSDVAIASPTRTVIIDARRQSPATATVDSSVQTDPKPSVWTSRKDLPGTAESSVCPSSLDLSTMPGNNLSVLRVRKRSQENVFEESTQDKGSIGTFSGALGYTGDSIKSAMNLVARIVPSEHVPLTTEEMNANEGDFPIQVMRVLGIPQEMRHNIYNETCSEVEVIQDVTSGTFEVLSDAIKWLFGSKSTDSPSKQGLMKGVQALLSMSAEVDASSEVWKCFHKDVSNMTEMVEHVVHEGAEMAQVASRKCSETIISLVAATNISAPSSTHELVNEPEPFKELSVIPEETESSEGSENNLHQITSTVEVKGQFPPMEQYISAPSYDLNTSEPLHAKPSIYSILKPTEKPEGFGESASQFRTEEDCSELFDNAATKTDAQPSQVYDTNNNRSEIEHTIAIAEIQERGIDLTETVVVPPTVKSLAASTLSLSKEPRQAYPATNWYPMTLTEEYGEQKPDYMLVPPNNSEIVFDRFKHDSQVVADLTELRIAVQKMYDEQTNQHSEVQQHAAAALSSQTLSFEQSLPATIEPISLPLRPKMPKFSSETQTEEALSSVMATYVQPSEASANQYFPHEFYVPATSSHKSIQVQTQSLVSDRDAVILPAAPTNVYTAFEQCSMSYNSKIVSRIPLPRHRLFQPNTSHVSTESNVTLMSSASAVRSSTVSLYYSGKGTEPQHSSMAIDSPVAMAFREKISSNQRSSIFSGDENNNPISDIESYQSFTSDQSRGRSRSVMTSRYVIKPRGWPGSPACSQSQNSNTPSGPARSRSPARTRFSRNQPLCGEREITTQSYGVPLKQFSSQSSIHGHESPVTSTATGYDRNSELSGSEAESAKIIRQKTYVKLPSAPYRKSSITTLSNASTPYRPSKCGKNSYLEFNNKNKDYKTLAQDYLKSLVKKISPESSISDMTSVSRR